MEGWDGARLCRKAGSKGHPRTVLNRDEMTVKKKRGDPSFAIVHFKGPSSEVGREKNGSSRETKTQPPLLLAPTLLVSNSMHAPPHPKLKLPSEYNLATKIAK